ncbi:MAG: FtsX-like permease family protein [Prolixibacteraceae bacterium]|nr:FtsX-like permease family protein [Prolixibacteraceae bacterium]
MIISVSWKNVWRNKKRSLIVICAVLLGTIAGVFTSGLMKGWVQQRIDSVIYTEMSHLKIHHSDYLLNEEMKYTVPQPEKIEKYLETNPEVKAFSRRIKIMTMANTSRGNTGLKLNGINLEEEKAVSDVWKKIVPGGGTYLSKDTRNPIVISSKTAEQLRIKNYKINTEVIDSLARLDVPDPTIEKLKSIEDIRFKTNKLFKKELGKLLTKKEIKEYGKAIVDASVHYRLRNKIVFTFTDAHGKMVYQTFRVCGIFKTQNTMFDQMNAFVLRDDIASLAGFSDTDYHEIALITSDDIDIDELKTTIKADYPELSVHTWKDLAPDAAMMSEFMGIWYAMIMGIILFALAFGIINTMLMAILERVKELGMLMAIGMNKKRVFSMIMYETVFLTLVGAVAGMGIGALLIVITGHTGLDFSSVSEGLEAIGYSAIIFPEIDAGFFFLVTLLVVLTGILASIIPARKALKLNPVEAIRTE